MSLGTALKATPLIALQTPEGRPAWSGGRRGTWFCPAVVASAGQPPGKESVPAGKPVAAVAKKSRLPTIESIFKYAQIAVGGSVALAVPVAHSTQMLPFAGSIVPRLSSPSWFPLFFWVQFQTFVANARFELFGKFVQIGAAPAGPANANALKAPDDPEARNGIVCAKQLGPMSMAAANRTAAAVNLEPFVISLSSFFPIEFWFT